MVPALFTSITNDSHHTEGERPEYAFLKSVRELFNMEGRNYKNCFLQKAAAEPLFLNLHKRKATNQPWFASIKLINVYFLF